MLSYYLIKYIYNWRCSYNVEGGRFFDFYSLIYFFYYCCILKFGFCLDLLSMFKLIEDVWNFCYYCVFIIYVNLGLYLIIFCYNL